MHDLPLFAGLASDPPVLARPNAPVPTTNGDARISTAVRNLLRRITIDTAGDEATLTLPRFSPDDYASLKPILESCGFRWVRTRDLHVGAAADADALQRAIDTGRYYDSKTELEFYATSDQGCAVLCKLLAMDLWQDEPHLLEPSAGEGDLVAAVRDTIPDATVTAVELDPRRAATLRKRFARDPKVRIVETDILAFSESGWDGVICNPPFGPALAHLRHVFSLARFAAPIVGIASLSRKQDEDLADWLHNQDAYTEPTEPGTFRDTPTKASFFTVRAEPSYTERLRRALTPHPSIQQPQIDRLREVSRDLHQLFTDSCNGVIEEDRYRHRVDALLTEARSIIGPEGIKLVPAWDPRAGHGIRLALPSGETNDWGSSGIIVPNARRSNALAERRTRAASRHAHPSIFAA